MNVQCAASKLHKKLNYASWLSAIGVCNKDNQDWIMVYLSRPAPEDIAFLVEGYEGYPVEVKLIGVVNPAF